MELQAVLCGTCGGAVAMEAGRDAPRCLFCGSTTVEAKPLGEDVEHPESFVPLVISEVKVLAAMRAFARGNIFHPTEFRRANLRPRTVFVPAWAWSARIETHWCALVGAPTRSGKRPITGAEEQPVTDVLTPASSALTRAELAALSPFTTAGAQPLTEHGPGAPCEVGTLTRSAAMAAARELLAGDHVSRIRARVEAQRIGASALVHDLAGRPILLPVWIETFRYLGRMHRILVNGQTGDLTGTHPISPWRVGAALLAGAVVIGLIGLVIVR